MIVHTQQPHTGGEVLMNEQCVKSDPTSVAAKTGKCHMSPQRQIDVRCLDKQPQTLADA
jgi:hypothetical protein